MAAPTVKTTTTKLNSIGHLLSRKKKTKSTSSAAGPPLLTHPHDASVEYLQNRFSLVNSRRVGYDHDEGQFTTIDKISAHPLLTEKPLGPTSDINSNQQQFIVARDKFEAEVLSPAVNFFSTCRISCSDPDTMWNDVMGNIQAAIEVYNGAGKGRKALRKLGDNASALQQYTKLLPDSMFTSSLIGGINLVLQAANTVSSLRDDVLTWLAEVPDRIHATAGSGLVQLYERYPDGVRFSARLHEISGKLYQAILEAITLMIQFLNTKCRKKFLVSLFKGPNQFPIAIEDAIARVETLSTLLSIEASNCLHHALHGLSTQQHSNHQELQQTLSSLSTQTALLDSKTDCSIHLINNLLALLRDVYQERSRRRRPFATKSMHAAFESRLLAALNPGNHYPPDLAAQDQAKLYRDAIRASDGIKDRINWALASHILRSWFLSKSHHILVIAGNTPDVGNHRQPSAMSYLCAFLGDAFQKARMKHVIIYCKNNSTSGYCGADILRSITTYMIQKFNTDYGFLQGEVPTEKQLSRPKKIASLLGKLLEDVDEEKEVTLFLMIDGLSRYETAETWETTKKAMGLLQGVIAGCRNLVIKLLVTYPRMQTGRSYKFKKMKGVTVDLLKVPEEIDGDAVGRIIDKGGLFSK